jgi:hypothetical protein
MTESASVFYGQRRPQVARGSLASKARFEADEQSIRLDLVLGSVNDLSLYQDWLSSARNVGSRMTPVEKQESRELAGNP